MATKTRKTAKAKLETLKRIDGQDDSAEGEIVKVTPTKIYRSVDELFGFAGCTYKTYDENTYRLSLSGLNMVDIQREMYRCSLQPCDNRNVAIERLLKQFRRVTASINGPDIKPVKLKLDAKARAIMLEGANRPT